jgi:hypothetical protein
MVEAREHGLARTALDRLGTHHRPQVVPHPLPVITSPTSCSRDRVAASARIQRCRHVEVTPAGSVHATPRSPHAAPARRAVRRGSASGSNARWHSHASGAKLRCHGSGATSQPVPVYGRKNPCARPLAMRSSSQRCSGANRPAVARPRRSGSPAAGRVRRGIDHVHIRTPVMARRAGQRAPAQYREHQLALRQRACVDRLLLPRRAPDADPRLWRSRSRAWRMKLRKPLTTRRSNPAARASARRRASACTVSGCSRQSPRHHAASSATTCVSSSPNSCSHERMAITSPTAWMRKQRTVSTKRSTPRTRTPGMQARIAAPRAGKTAA